MFKPHALQAAVAAVLCGLAAPALAQQTLERVEVTGSAIKRIAAEGALPVQVISRKEIERSGVTSTVDLLQNLAAVQGGTVEAGAIGGGGGGLATVSLHNLGEDRTLVLLNGRRLVGEAGGAVDLSMVPLAIVERVEVLTDGASAIYGSDAVAGVVNFITKRNYRDGNIALSVSRPEEKGGAEQNFSISKGFGDLDKDGFNILAGLSADKRDKLVASQREFSKTGVMHFQHNGKNYRFFNGSPAAIPGNVDVAGESRSAYLAEKGVCPPQHVQEGPTCYFDYANTVEAWPDRERSNLFASAAVKLGQDHTLTVDLLSGRTFTSGKIAAAPGAVLVDPAGPFGSYLKLVGYTGTDPAVVRYRAIDLGNRDAEYERKNNALWLTLEGQLQGWDYSANLGMQKTRYEESNTGYPLGRAFGALLRSGLWNPFVLPGNQSEAAKAEAAKIMLSGVYQVETSELTSADLRASRELFQLAGGHAALAVGASYMADKLTSEPSDVARGKGGPTKDDSRFGDAGAMLPYSATRKAYGLFGELSAPLTKQLELTTALRYDNYKDIDSATNGKIGLRYQPAKEVLVRASLGTGFRAPTLRQRFRPLMTFGVTNTPYRCSEDMAKMAASLGAECRPGNLQYDAYIAGDAKIKPEESRQATLGVRFEPTANFTIGADLWWVGVEGVFGEVDQNEAFANVFKYPDRWLAHTDPVTGRKYLAYNRKTSNLGKRFVSGVDLDMSGRAQLPMGRLSSSFKLTYMIRDTFQLIPKGEYYSIIGDNHPAIAQQTFRWKGNFVNTLQHGAWAHTLAVNFQSGYKDINKAVTPLDANGRPSGPNETVRLDVPDQFTFDLQTEYQYSKALKFSLGVINLLDEKPPLSLRTIGSHMLGFDYRYFNPLGRTVQARASWNF
jgi:iron complex outermembrane receptor protein